MKKKIPWIKIVLISILSIGILFLSYQLITNKSAVTNLVSITIEKVFNKKESKKVSLTLTKKQNDIKPVEATDIKSTVDSSISLVERLVTILSTFVPTYFLIKDHNKNKKSKREKA